MRWDQHRWRRESRRGWFMGVVGLCWLGLSVAGAATGSSEKGRSLFMENCQHCHGAQGDGKGEMAGYLTPPPSNLTDKATQAKTDEQLRAIILDGRAGTAMAGFQGALTDGQLRDIIAYLRSLGGRP